MSKKRSQGSLALQRQVGTRDQRQRFLIVCEGKETEPNYFRAFYRAVRVPTLIVEVEGIGDNTISLVRRTIDLRNADDYDQTWCVFDRDNFPPENFNEAVALAKRENINVAYSNEAFELWYLLHFHYYNTGISRHQYNERLSDHLGYRYEKTSKTMYAELLDRQQAAIRNARKLLDCYDPPRPCDDKPSTTVHLLVEALNNAGR